MGRGQRNRLYLYLHILEDVDTNLPSVGRTHILCQQPPGDPSLHVVNSQEDNTLVDLRAEDK